MKTQLFLIQMDIETTPLAEGKAYSDWKTELAIAIIDSCSALRELESFAKVVAD